MEQWGSDPATVWEGQLVSYARLLELVATWRSQLDSEEIAQGRVVSMVGDYSPQACALMLALIERGAIVVPLTAAVEAHRQEFLATAEVEVEITFGENDDWTIHRRDATPMNPLTRRLIDRACPGLVVFSSGSTGKSKAVLHDFEAVLEKFKVTRPRKRMLTFLLLDHLGGINTLFHALSNGGTAVVVRSRDPEVICQAIERFRVQILPTSPTFLNLLLLSSIHRQYDLSSLETITYGTEAMPEETLRRLHEAFPNVRLQQTYGLTELGVLRSQSRSDDSLWVRVGGEGFETRVVDGVLHIRARSAMVGYLNAPSPFDEDGWLNTGDEVEVDGEYIHILGRRSEIINVGGQKVHPVEVENVLLRMPNVVDALVNARPNPIMGQVVGAAVQLAEPEDAATLKRRVREFCKGQLASYKVPAVIEITDQIPFGARFKKMRREA
jgi:acyl-coenzyme A synthetase/AMP-(fatty) acid ligase